MSAGAQTSLPLAGLRVLELGQFIAGPYAGSILASLGAEVVKVEPIDGGDPFRRGQGTADPFFVQSNAGKKSLALNLKSTEGVGLVKALLPHFDALIENSRPGKMAALGLGADEARTINPGLVYASVSGFGDGGPWRDRAAYDMIGQSMAGFLAIMNDPGQPRLTGTCIGDLVTGLSCAFGIVVGLLGRERNPARRGLDLRTSLLEAMSTITLDAMTQSFGLGVDPSRETRHPPGQNFCLRTADGGAITLHMSSSQKFWLGLTKAMEREDLAVDPHFATYKVRIENYFRLRPLVEVEFLKHGRDEWERRLVACDVPFAPVLTPAEVASHPQTTWLGLFAENDQGDMLVQPPWRFDGRRPLRRGHAPAVGEHSREVALQVLPSADVDRLIANGVIRQHVST
jgi:crotonobetainyl-CoA:carnitine CoA-transferase CaiB-like acyl-CoA transferase